MLQERKPGTLAPRFAGRAVGWKDRRWAWHTQCQHIYFNTLIYYIIIYIYDNYFEYFLKEAFTSLLDFGVAFNQWAKEHVWAGRPQVLAFWPQNHHVCLFAVEAHPTSTIGSWLRRGTQGLCTTDGHKDLIPPPHIYPIPPMENRIRL